MKTAYGIAAILMLSACSGGEKPEEEAVANNSSVALVNETVRPAKADPVVAAKDVEIERKDDILEFEYGWPKQAAAIAPLNTWLKGHADDRFREAYASAAEGQKSAKEDGYPFNKYSYSQSWDDVADTPAVLVLEGEGHSYTGGAHGMPFATSLIWDKKTGKRLALKNVVDVAKLSAAAKTSFCRALDAERAKKRGDDADRMAKESLPEFSQCPNMAQQEIIPFSSNGKALDGLKIVIGPYVAGPYVEGSYEIELPMTAEYLKAVKPSYAGWFAVGR